MPPGVLEQFLLVKSEYSDSSLFPFPKGFLFHWLFAGLFREADGGHLVSIHSEAVSRAPTFKFQR
ncbi:hypothetical protein M413DRAFT_145735 [Hebeloma cylindrosporum]|uniref:Uncharacterized protein n=1 Tax=Hebeloma cylindrosporum TaxID=76867 RepID=A0A0C2YJS4_HEBCY|nr:hypothetical protein M413DRAFT_145735 [Hebeloma cylindrosporum h7]